MAKAKPEYPSWYKPSRRLPGTFKWHLERKGKTTTALILEGDWDKRAPIVPSRLNRTTTEVIIGKEFQGKNLDCLKWFSKARALRVLNYNIVDINGIYEMPNLEALTIDRVRAKFVKIDCSYFPKLKKLVCSCSTLKDVQRSKKITHIELRHISSIKRLDLSGLSKLRVLQIGPANGIEELTLTGLPSLDELGLNLMRSLKKIEASDLFEAVRHLDIRGTPNISPKFLAQFKRLQSVEITPKSRFTAKDFPFCKPDLIEFPV